MINQSQPVVNEGVNDVTKVKKNLTITSDMAKVLHSMQNPSH